MDYLSYYRNICHSELSPLPIINIYREVISGKRKALHSGTWEKDENVIIIVRYALEVHLGLKKEQIPRINRTVINDQKLWGALNRFKSIRKLITFVYPGRYNEFDFSRVPNNYWNNTQNIRDRFEWYLKKEGIMMEEIPQKVDSNMLIKWGFSNPLKRHGHSPFRLIDTLYPGVFRETDFKKIPQRYAKDKNFLRDQFLEMLKKENIPLEDAPTKVTQQMLNKYRFSGALKNHQGSPSKLLSFLFPSLFSTDNFHTKPNGYWKDISNVKRTIMDLIEKEGIAEADVPKFITKKRLMQERLGGLLHEYNGSPIEIVNAVFPGKYDITEFQRVPNQYWYSQKNRVQAMRIFCEKRKISRELMPLLNRAYFQKHFPRFISMADRHYDSKFYRWIIESFPEYTFHPEEFNLLVGIDGQLCDSKEELAIHNFLVESLVSAKVIRESQRYVNNQYDEVYIPDWIIYQNHRKFIIEYFGLYGSNRYKTYKEKADRKIEFFQSLKDYEFIAIMPDDFREHGFDRIISLLAEKGMS